MHFTTPLASIPLLLPLLVGALVLPYQNEQPLMPFQPVETERVPVDPDVKVEGYRIPTIHESAVQARRILQLESIGTLSTVFPNDENARVAENRPAGLGGMPVGLMDYYSACEPDTHPGDPTILEINIATNFKNVAAGSNITMSLRWHPPHTPRHYPKMSRESEAILRTKTGYSEAALPRFALLGYLEDITESEVRSQDIGKCFARQHPDSRLWFPGNRIHTSKWVRLVVKHVYWIGSFGDRAYIGWIPVEEWRGVTQKEIDGIRLPGEHDES